MKTILLTRAGPDFDPTKQEPIGAWCFAGAEDVYPDWEQIAFSKTFVDLEKQAAAEMAYRLCGHMVTTLGTALNQRHNRNHGPQFWRFVLMPWIIWVVDYTWRVWVHSQSFVKDHSDQSFVFPVYRTDVCWDFHDYPDFLVRGFCGEAFSAWLHSRALNQFAPKTWRRELQPFEPPAPKTDRAAILGSQEDNFLRRTLRPSNFTHVAGIRYEKLIFGPLIRLFPRREARPLNPAQEDYRPEEEFPEAYLEFLTEIAEVMTPRYLREDFDALERQAFAEKFTPGALMVGAPDAADMVARFRAAAATEKGQRIVISQHGGGYGTFAMNGDAAQMEYVQHAFFSWGWRSQGNYPGNVLPVASPLLSKLRDKHREKERSLILVGTRMTLDSPRIVSAPEPTEWIEYRREKVRFIEALEQAPRGGLQYRPYKRAAMALEDETYLRKRVLDLKTLDGNLHQAMLRSRLLVIDHPTTTLHIALAANIPTLAFWHESAWPFCEQSKPIMDALRECGIQFEDATKAAQQANRIWSDVSTWWNSSQVQTARQNFCDQYALTSRTWWWDWLKALYKV